MSRIIAGSDAPGVVPWQVSLRGEGMYPDKPGDHICGGTILNPTTILTASHCYPEAESQINQEIKEGLNNIWVVAGAMKLSDTNVQAVKTAKLIKHPKYDPAKTNNDVAILKLATPLTFNDKVQPACLPAADFKPEAKGAKAVVSGWGKVSGDAKDVSPVLRWTELPLMTNADCIKKSHWSATDIFDTMICAGYISGKTPEKMTCQGDSGGPLVVNNGGTATVYGVVSFGPGTCGFEGFTSVFARVSVFLDFIKANM